MIVHCDSRWSIKNLWNYVNWIIYLNICEITRIDRPQLQRSIICWKFVKFEIEQVFLTFHFILWYRYKEDGGVRRTVDLYDLSDLYDNMGFVAVVRWCFSRDFRKLLFRKLCLRIFGRNWDRGALESKWMNFDIMLHIRNHVLQKRRWTSDSGILWWGTVFSIYFWFSYFLDIVALSYSHFLVSDTRLFNHWFELVWTRYYDIKTVLFNHLNTLLQLIFIMY